MKQDRFTERFAEVRSRFVAKLGGRIEELDAAIPSLAGEGPGVIEAVASAHRRMHDLCGLSPTVGYPAVGRAARNVEKVLRAPLKAARGLTEEELGALRQTLAGLRAAAHSEIPANGKGGE